MTVNGLLKATYRIKDRKKMRFVSGFFFFVIIVLVLFLLGSDYIMFDHFGMGLGLVHSFRSVIGTNNGNICTLEMRTNMLKKPLRIKNYTNIDIHGYEMSGCFEMNTNESGINRLINERNRIGTTCVPFEKRFLNNTGTEKLTALLSVPGSGNHWVRHLLEEITGIYTGSVYGNKQIDQVFKGEHTIHNVIASKTHYLDTKVFSRAIIIVRDPFESTLAETNRGSGNQTTSIKKSQFNFGGFKKFLNSEINRRIPAGWINRFPGDLFILYYDKLKTDLANSLIKVAAFLHSEVSLERLLCTLNNKDGSYKRVGNPEFMSRKNFVNENMEKSILQWKRANHNALLRRKTPWATN